MAAINRPDDVVSLSAPVDILCSYHYFKAVDMAAIKGWGTRIIGDSGAFSAMSTGSPIELGDFFAWCHKWEQELYWTASLDVIGDAEATYRNWVDARKDGLDLVPTLHYGAKPSAMDRYAEQGVTFMGLGGMVPRSSEPERLLRWLVPIFRHARDHYPDMRFHGWGVSAPVLLDQLPFYSADSSGFASAFQFGTLRLWNPDRGRFYSVKLDGKSIMRWRSVLARHYGLEDARLIARATAANRRLVGRVAMRAVQLYGEWLRSRQQVSPPAFLSGGGPGPKAVAAMGAPSMQPIKALSPDDESPPQGPRTACAMGSTYSAQWQAVSDRKDMKDVQIEAPAGPLVVLADTSHRTLKP